MVKSTLVVGLRALLCGTMALVLFSPAQAQSRIGVTQSTENNPMGKPPAGVDRILRVGTDIQANETVTTTSNDRAHLVFLDGTTVTIGPDSRLTIDKFVYDPATRKGELAMSTTSGMLRVIGGRISKTSEITVTTPSSTLGIRGGIMVVDHKAGSPGTPATTTAFFLFGTSMTVKGAGGQTSTFTVPNIQVATSTGGPPGPPTVIQGSLSAALANLVGNASAQAAVFAAIQTLVADNIGSPVTLAVLLQTIINASTPNALGTSTIVSTTGTFIQVTENPGQTGQSPN